MREIKFRGRDEQGRWHFGMLRQWRDQSFAIETTQGLAVDFVDPATVGQFTGLLDSNGQEIYEGDVVERDNSYFQKTCPTLPKTTVGVVKWCDGEFIVTGSYKLFSSSDKFPIRVIGNVHDSPELLEGKDARG